MRLRGRIEPREERLHDGQGGDDGRNGADKGQQRYDPCSTRIGGGFFLEPILRLAARYLRTVAELDRGVPRRARIAITHHVDPAAHRINAAALQSGSHIERDRSFAFPHPYLQRHSPQACRNISIMTSLQSKAMSCRKWWMCHRICWSSGGAN